MDTKYLDYECLCYL